MVASRIQNGHSSSHGGGSASLYKICLLFVKSGAKLSVLSISAPGSSISLKAFWQKLKTLKTETEEGQFVTDALERTAPLLQREKHQCYWLMG